MAKDIEEKVSPPSSSQHERENKDNQKVPFYMLFTFADRFDVNLMIVGTICAIANGLSQPLMTVIFGKLINTFGSTDISHIVQEVSKVYNSVSLISFLFFYFNFWCNVCFESSTHNDKD